MKTHFGVAHPGFRGTRGAKCKARRHQIKQEPCRPVHCQQMFSRRYGSRLFEVEASPDMPQAPNVESPPPSKMEQARQMLARRMATIEDREQRIIEDGVYNAPGPWVTTTGFAKYLRKLDRDELLQSVATPEMEEEPVFRIIWEAMQEMTQQCQATVDQHAGRFVRKEVMRTEEDQSLLRLFETTYTACSCLEVRRNGRHGFKLWKDGCAWMAVHRLRYSDIGVSERWQKSELISLAYMQAVCKAQKLSTEKLCDIGI